MHHLDMSRLWAVVALLLGEVHPGAEIRDPEVVRTEGMPVEVDLTTIGCLDEAVACEWEEPRHSSLGPCGMPLHGSTQMPHVILEPPAGRIERITECHVDVFVGMIVGMVAVDHDLPAGHHEIDPHRIESSLTLVAMGLCDDDMAARDPVAHLLELGHMIERGITHVVIDW